MLSQLRILPIVISLYCTAEASRPASDAHAAHRHHRFVILMMQRQMMLCPPNLVGRVIGCNGDTINHVQSASGARIQIDHTIVNGSCTITILGSSHAVQYAGQMLDELIGQGAGAYDWNAAAIAASGATGFVDAHGGSMMMLAALARGEQSAMMVPGGDPRCTGAPCGMSGTLPGYPACAPPYVQAPPMAGTTWVMGAAGGSWSGPGYFMGAVPSQQMMMMGSENSGAPYWMPPLPAWQQVGQTADGSQLPMQPLLPLQPQFQMRRPYKPAHTAFENLGGGGVSMPAGPIGGPGGMSDMMHALPCDEAGSDGSSAKSRSRSARRRSQRCRARIAREELAAEVSELAAESAMPGGGEEASVPDAADDSDDAVAGRGGSGVGDGPDRGGEDQRHPESAGCSRYTDGGGSCCSEGDDRCGVASAVVGMPTMGSQEAGIAVTSMEAASHGDQRAVAAPA